MSDWRYNSNVYWSNQGSGHEPQYPSTIDEEVLADEQAYVETAGGYTYALPQHPQPQDDQQQAYWTDEPQTYQAEDQTAYDQQYYQAPDDQGHVPYTPTTYTGSMDVNVRYAPSPFSRPFNPIAIAFSASRPLTPFQPSPPFHIFRLIPFILLSSLY